MDRTLDMDSKSSVSADLQKKWDLGGLAEEWRMVQAHGACLIHLYESFAFALTQYLLYWVDHHCLYLEKEI